MKFLCMLFVVMARCDMICSSGFVNHIIFSHAGLCGMLCVFLNGKNITADTPASVSTKCLPVIQNCKIQIVAYAQRAKSAIYGFLALFKCI